MSIRVKPAGVRKGHSGFGSIPWQLVGAHLWFRAGLCLGHGQVQPVRTEIFPRGWSRALTLFTRELEHCFPDASEFGLDPLAARKERPHHHLTLLLQLLGYFDKADLALMEF